MPVRAEARGSFVFAIFLISFAAFREAGGTDVQVMRTDGSATSGEWLGSTDGTGLDLRSPEGLRTVAFDDLTRVLFESAKVAANGAVTFHLADGGMLRGELLRSASAAVVGRVIVGELVFPFDALAGVQLAPKEASSRAEEMFQAAMRSRLPGQDVLITRDIEETKSLRGRLEELDVARGSFVFGDRTRTFPTEKIFGIVFAAGAGRRPSYSATLELTDGSTFSGNIEAADAVGLRVATSLGVSVHIPVNAIASVSFRSPRVTFVSDLEPASERTEGLLHRPWPVRKDQNSSAAPLTMRGRVFEKGLGVHSRTELQYDIGGGYERFVATVGIDDSVRPRGSVVFRVLGDVGVEISGAKDASAALEDRRVLFESGLMTGVDPPRDIVVGVAGVRRLTLVVDYGDGSDLSDHAAWGGARLLRATTKAAETKPRPPG